MAKNRFWWFKSTVQLCLKRYRLEIAVFIWAASHFPESRPLSLCQSPTDIAALFSSLFIQLLSLNSRLSRIFGILHNFILLGHSTPDDTGSLFYEDSWCNFSFTFISYPYAFTRDNSLYKCGLLHLLWKYISSRRDTRFEMHGTESWSIENSSKHQMCTIVSKEFVQRLVR